MARRFIAALAAALALAACAPLAPLDTVPLGPPLERFVAEGRISLRQDERRDHLRFRWEHGPEGDTVLLMSPLGQGLAELTRDATGARLMQPGRPPLVAADLRQLALDVFGAALPLDALADWLRGAHPAAAGDVEGWKVSVGGTAALGHRRLPRLLEVVRGEVELKLLVDAWDDGERTGE